MLEDETVLDGTFLNAAAFKAEALRLGAADAGLAEAGPLTAEWPYLQAYLTAGAQGGMTYLTRSPETRCRPDVLLPDVRTVAVCAFSYFPRPDLYAYHPRIARFAQGEDYHRVIRRFLKQLTAYVIQRHPDARCRGFVDTAPILEKAWAVRAGLGRIGRNNLLQHPRLGSYIFLGVLLTDVPANAYDHAAESAGGAAAAGGLTPDITAGSPTDKTATAGITANITAGSPTDRAATAGITANITAGSPTDRAATAGITPTAAGAGTPLSGLLPDRCRRCRACVDACPTGALSLERAPRLRADHCLAYATVEQRADEQGRKRFPALRPQAAGAPPPAIFGCDVCQTVCPANRPAAAEKPHPAFIPAPGLAEMTRSDFARLDEAAFQQRFARSAIRRAGTDGLKANLSLWQ